MAQPYVVVLIPAYKPGPDFPGLISDLVRLGVERICVVDDGSGVWFRARFDEAARHPQVHIVRHAINLGKGMTLLYLLYFLRDRIHYSRLFPGHKAEDGLVVLVLVYLLGVVLTAVTSGRISDRSGRRKLPVLISGLVMAVAATILALWPSWPAAMFEPEFTRDSLLSALEVWVDTAGWKRIALSSLKRDVDCFLRTYLPARGGNAILEDSLDCPLVELTRGEP